MLITLPRLCGVSKSLDYLNMGAQSAETYGCRGNECGNDYFCSPHERCVRDGREGAGRVGERARLWF